MLPDHWNCLLSVLYSRHHLLCFSCKALRLLSVCLWLNGSRLCLLLPVVSVFSMYDFFSVTKCRLCRCDYLTSSVLVQQFQWVMKWDCHRAESPSLWSFCDVLTVSLSAHRTACVTIWGPNGCSLLCLFQCLPQTCMKLAFSCTPVFLSLSHSNVCPSTGQCPNGLSCFPSLSFCKYSGSPSDFTRSRQRSVHACLNATTHATHSVNVCLCLSSFFPSPSNCDSISQTLRILKWFSSD